MDREEKEELIDEIVSEFRYEIEGLEDHEDEQVEGIIDNILAEYMDEDDFDSITEEITSLLWEEWELYLDALEDDYDEDCHIDHDLDDEEDDDGE